MLTATAKPESLTVSLERTELIRALDRARHVVPVRFPKPILTCVRLDASQGLLRVQATDGELSLFTHVPTEGELVACVVPCSELIKRLKASKSPVCGLSLSDNHERLIVNGGRVEHALDTLAPEDFPDVPSQLEGDSIEVDAAELVHALKVAGQGVAHEPSRYAIDGILLESDARGTRLVATDGRRLVIVELGHAGELNGKAILPQRFCRLIEKFTDKHTDFLVLAVQRDQAEKGTAPPACVYAAGPDWLLSTFECDGHFPIYRDVVPRSHSKFAVDRTALVETLGEVSLAANEDSRMVHVDLSSKEVQLSARAPGVGKSEATLAAEFLGGGDSAIHTAFNPPFLLDALKTMSGDEVVIDVDQNGYGCDGKVFGKPALMYVRHDPSIRWVIMPVNAGLEATRENLGSNYPEGMEDKQ
jgi:DNA polymerase-3 subunit beta